MIDFEKYFRELKQTYKENDLDFLELNNTKENLLLHLYSFYHYADGDEDKIFDLTQNVRFNPINDNVMHGFLPNPEAEGEILDILCVHYATEFDPNKVYDMVQKVKQVVMQVKTSTYPRMAMDSGLQNYWGKYSPENINIKVITNCTYGDKKKVKSFVDDLVKGADYITAEVIFGDDIEEEVLTTRDEAKDVESAELSLFNSKSYLQYEDSIIVSISAKSLKDLYQKYSKSGLFSANLRYYIKKPKVDDKIVESITTDYDNFWYKNNGIIILCDSFDLNQETQKVVLHNFSIINGGQTTTLIGKTAFDNDFAIVCKIIPRRYEDDSAQAEFISNVAEASNTQKAISSKDLIANKPEQRMLKEELKGVNIWLTIKNGDAAPDKTIYKEAWQKGKNDELAQLIYSFIYQKPGIARNNKASLFSDNKKYEQIFAPKYNMNLLKDLFVLRSAYTNYNKKVVKSTDDPVKIGLLKNGMYFMVAIFGVVSKLYFSPELLNQYKALSGDNAKEEYMLSGHTINHGILIGSGKSIQNAFNDVFDELYEKFYRRAFNRIKTIKPEIAYSNFTKTQSNYTSFVYECLKDYFEIGFGEKLTNLLKKIYINPTLTIMNDDDALFKDYMQEYFSPSDIENKIMKELEEKLREFRSTEWKKNLIKNKKAKAYEIFNDAEMKNFMKSRPQTIEEVKEKDCFDAKGVDSKLPKYGEKIVKIINAVLSKYPN